MGTGVERLPRPSRSLFASQFGLEIAAFIRKNGNFGVIPTSDINFFIWPASVGAAERPGRWQSRSKPAARQDFAERSNGFGIAIADGRQRDDGAPDGWNATERVRLNDVEDGSPTPGRFFSSMAAPTPTARTMKAVFASCVADSPFQSMYCGT
jgi:hypothetical protein